MKRMIIIISMILMSFAVGQDCTATDDCDGFPCISSFGDCNFENGPGTCNYTDYSLVDPDCYLYPENSVCNCNGITYTNECEALFGNGTGIDYEGACEEDCESDICVDWINNEVITEEDAIYSSNFSGDVGWTYEISQDTIWIRQTVPQFEGEKLYELVLKDNGINNLPEFIRFSVHIYWMMPYNEYSYELELGQIEFQDWNFNELHTGKITNNSIEHPEVFYFWAESENTTCYSSTDCEDGFACIPPTGDCDFATGPGECMEQGGGCYDDWVPVCGCEGETYSNECYAHRDGMGIEYEGGCEEEGLIEFTIQNVDYENENFEIVLNSNTEISAFSLNITGIGIGNINPNFLQDGWSVSANGTTPWTILNFNGLLLPPGEYIIDVDGFNITDEICLNGTFFTDANNEAFDENSVIIGDCVNNLPNPGDECIVDNYTGVLDCDLICVHSPQNYGINFGNGECYSDIVDDANYNCIEFGYECGDCDPDWDGTDPLGYCELICGENQGDFNNDGVLNVLDFVSLISQIHSFEEPTFQELTCGDINEDGEINIDDYPCYGLIPLNENENNTQTRDMVVITVIDTIAILDSNSFTIPIDVNVSTAPSGEYVESFGFDLIITELSTIDSIFITDGFPHQEGFMVTQSFQDNRIRITGVNLNYTGLPDYDGRFFDITVFTDETFQSTSVQIEEIYVNGGCSYGSNTSVGNDGFLTVIDCEAGDLDGDGMWSITDIMIMLGFILETTGPPTAEEICNGDNDGDGALSVNDFEIYNLMCGQFPLPDPYSEIVGFIFSEEASPFMIDDSLFSIPIYKVEEPSIDGFQFDVVIEDYENFELIEIIPNPMIAELGWMFETTVIDNSIRIMGFNFTSSPYEFDNGPLVTLKLSNPGVVMSTGISIENVFSHGECMVPFEALGMIAEITIEDYLPDATLAFDCPDEVIVGSEGNVLPIDIDASEDVWGIQFEVPFDPELIEFTNVTAGEVINEGEMLSWTVNEDTLFIISFDFDGTPTMFAGAGNIFNLHYNVIGDVEEDIHLEFMDVSMVGYNGQQLEVDVSDECSVQIVDSVEVTLTFDCPDEVIAGSEGNEFTIMMENSVNVDGIQIEIEFDPNIIEITNVITNNHLGVTSWSFTDSSHIMILEFTGTGWFLTPGIRELYLIEFTGFQEGENQFSFSNIQMAQPSGNPIENIDFSDSCTIPVVEPFSDQCVELFGLPWDECLSESGYGIYNGNCEIVYCGTVDGYGNDWSPWIYDTMEACEEECPQQMVHFSIENQHAFTGDSIEVDIIMDNNSGSAGGIQMEILFDEEILGLNNVTAGAQYPPDWLLNFGGNTILGFSFNATYLLMGSNQQLFQMQISALNEGMSIFCMDDITVSDPNGQPHPTSSYCGVIQVEDMPLQHFTNILNGFESAYTNFDELSGNGTMPVIFIEESDGVDVGDEIGLFDIGGIIDDECPPEYGEILVGASIFTGGPLEITTYGAIQNCDDDMLLPGFVSGNEFIVKIWKAEEDQEYPAYYNGQTGELIWTNENINIPMLAPAPLVSFDVNLDGELNVMDIILTVSVILGELGDIDISWGQEHTADTNSDGLINVIDILVMVNTILEE